MKFNKYSREAPHTALTGTTCVKQKKRRTKNKQKGQRKEDKIFGHPLS